MAVPDPTHPASLARILNSPRPFYQEVEEEILKQVEELR